MDDRTAFEGDVEALIAYADGVRRDDEALFERRGALVRRNPRMALELGRTLMSSANPDRREMAIDLIGVAAQIDHPLRDQALSLVRTAMDDTDEGPLSAAIVQLAHLNDEFSRDKILSHANHPDPVVRHAVAGALPSVGLTEPALIALVKLTIDEDDDVRDWATLGLAVTAADSEAIRDALLARVEDDSYSIRIEAIMSLARRQEERVRPHLVRELADPRHAEELEDATDFLDHGTGRDWLIPPAVV
jgi:HEAT repeat protein